MAILVIGGTGTVGSSVVRELLAREAEDVRVLTRHPEKVAARLPASVTPVVGDLLEPSTARSAFRGVDRVFILNVVSPTEAHEGLMAVNGARLGGAKRIVYLSVHRVDEAPHLPHFGAKLPVEIAIKASGIPFTILRPNNFYQNDFWFEDAIRQYGIYPQPIGDVGLSRVDVRDIAEAAAVVLTASGSGHEGETYNLVGPESVTGRSTAEVWSRALDKPIRYGGNDLDVWEEQALKALPASIVFDYRLMYAFFQEQGLKATPEDITRQTKLIGHPPRSFEQFAAEVAGMWR